MRYHNAPLTKGRESGTEGRKWEQKGKLKMGELIQEIFFLSLGDRHVGSVVHDDAAFPVVFPDVSQVYQM
jgi:hypothetical protein